LFISNPGAFGFGASRARLLAVLRLTETEMFPLSFRLRAQVAGHEEFTSREAAPRASSRFRAGPRSAKGASGFRSEWATAAATQRSCICALMIWVQTSSRNSARVAMTVSPSARSLRVDPPHDNWTSSRWPELRLSADLLDGRERRPRAPSPDRVVRTRPGAQGSASSDSRAALWVGGRRYLPVAEGVQDGSSRGESDDGHGDQDRAAAGGRPPPFQRRPGH
jgi:hypothetical protein